MNKTILVVNYSSVQCGIYQWGLDTFNSLSKSSKYTFVYREANNPQALYASVLETSPQAVIYNYSRGTTPWLNSGVLQVVNLPSLGTNHLASNQLEDISFFDYQLFLDPTVEESERIFATPRLLIATPDIYIESDKPSIGSFGFGMPEKGWERLIRQVNEEFDEARIYLNMPFNTTVDKGGHAFALKTAAKCREISLKPGVELLIDHGFYDKQMLRDILANNTINAFFYEPARSGGISSVIDHALSVKRPIAITKTPMFKHIYNTNPSICIEDSSLKTIIANGTSHLEQYYDKWSEANFVAKFESILDKVFTDLNP